MWKYKYCFEFSKNEYHKLVPEGQIRNKKPTQIRTFEPLPTPLDNIYPNSRCHGNITMLENVNLAKKYPKNLKKFRLISDW